MTRQHGIAFQMCIRDRYKDANGEFLARIVCVEPEGKLILEDEKLIKRGYMFKLSLIHI